MTANATKYQRVIKMQPGERNAYGKHSARGQLAIRTQKQCASQMRLTVGRVQQIEREAFHKVRLGLMDESPPLVAQWRAEVTHWRRMARELAEFCPDESAEIARLAEDCERDLRPLERRHT